MRQGIDKIYKGDQIIFVPDSAVRNTLKILLECRLIVTYRHFSHLIELVDAVNLYGAVYRLGRYRITHLAPLSRSYLRGIGFHNIAVVGDINYTADLGTDIGKAADIYINSVGTFASRVVLDGLYEGGLAVKLLFSRA